MPFSPVQASQDDLNEIHREYAPLTTLTIVTTQPTSLFHSLLKEPGLLAARPGSVETRSSFPLRYRPIHDAEQSVTAPCKLWKLWKVLVFLHAILEGA